MDDPLKLRLANINDSEAIFRWRNDPQTRLNSLDQNEISYDTHVGWFQASIDSAKRILYIAELTGIPAGVVRADFISDRTIELSWNVAPEYRGKKIGEKMLALACDCFSGCTIVAKIKNDNKASVRIAEKCGFHVSKAGPEFDIWEKI